MLQRVRWIALLTFVVACVGGCVTVVPPTKPLDPQTVYLCDYGVHSSLLLPTSDGRFVEYAYGDWGYSAKNSVGPNDALGALFLSGGAAFGRRYHPANPNGGPPPKLENAPGQFASVRSIITERAAVSRLLEELDDRYRAGSGEPLYNPINKVTYVRDKGRYSFFNNCNHFTNWCLCELGCGVGGVTTYASYAIKKTESQPQIQPLRQRPDAATATAATE